MKTCSLVVIAALFPSSGYAVAQTELFPVVQTETVYLDLCEQEKEQHEAGTAPWIRAECQIKWQWAQAAGPMAETLLAMSIVDVTRSPAQIPVSGTAIPADINVLLYPTGIHFDWQEIGSAGRYNVIDALKSRGVTLQSLGCPQFPSASMGQEKVMLAERSGGQPFVITVYSRAAPTSLEPGVYEVDADFSGMVPDMVALQAGRYLGGGGRAFAVDPTGWIAECPDPE